MKPGATPPDGARPAAAEAVQRTNTLCGEEIKLKCRRPCARSSTADGRITKTIRRWAVEAHATQARLEARALAIVYQEEFRFGSASGAPES
jgi:hypothetical protein